MRLSSMAWPWRVIADKFAAYRVQMANQRLEDAVEFTNIDHHCRISDRPIADRLKQIRRAARNGADLDMVVNSMYPTPLICTATQGDSQLEILAELVRLGADVNFDLSKRDPHAVYNNAFQAAVGNREYRAAVLLIDLGANVTDPSILYEILCRNTFADAFYPDVVSMVRRMIFAGAVCTSETVNELRKEQRGGYLPCSDDTMTMADLVEEWLAERRGKALDAALPEVEAAPQARQRF